jgi:hypothetical protein
MFWHVQQYFFYITIQPQLSTYLQNFAIVLPYIKKKL